MSIMTVYVQGKSKKAINEVLKANQHALEALKYDIFTGNDVYDLETLPVGTAVKVFEKYVGGIPYAKAYGTIARDKAGRVFIK